MQSREGWNRDQTLSYRQVGISIREGEAEGCAPEVRGGIRAGATRCHLHMNLQQELHPWRSSNIEKERAYPVPAACNSII